MRTLKYHSEKYGDPPILEQGSFPNPLIPPSETMAYKERKHSFILWICRFHGLMNENIEKPTTAASQDSHRHHQ
jgi:hypothetical protein